MYAIMVKSFLIRIFLVLLWVNRCVFSPSVFLRVLLILFLCCLSIRLFCYLRSHILLQNSFVSSSSVWWYVFVQSPPTPLLAGRFFPVFWNVLFCLYCYIWSRYLFSLPSFNSNFWLISPCCIVCFTCVAFFFFVPTCSRYYHYNKWHVLYVKSYNN